MIGQQLCPLALRIEERLPDHSGGSLTVAGVPIERDALTLGASFSNEPGKNLSLYADYNVELRGSGQTTHALVAGLRCVSQVAKTL